MANVSSSNSLGERVPKLRFPEFEGEWDIKPLSEISNYRKEKAVFSKNLYVSTENMEQQFGSIERYSGTNTISGNLFYTGDILFANIRPYLKKVWKAEFEGCCSSDVLVLHTTKELQPDFLYFIIANNNFINYVMTGVKGSKMPRGDKEHIMCYPATFPSIYEQKKVSQFLGLMDYKIKIQRQLIKSLKYTT